MNLESTHVTASASMPAEIEHQEQGESDEQGGLNSLRLRVVLLAAVGPLVVALLLLGARLDPIWLLPALLISVVAATAAWVVVTRASVDPLEHLRRSTDAVASGESLQTLDLPESPELAHVVANFNRLTRRIREQKKRLAELAGALEEAKAKQSDAAEYQERYSNTIAISEIGQQITSSLSLETVLETTFRNISAMMDVGGLCIGILDAERKVIRMTMLLEHGRRQPEEIIELEDRNSFAAWSLRHGREILLNDVRDGYARYVDMLQPGADGRIAGSVIFAPMTLGTTVVGVIGIQSPRANAFSEHHLAMVRSLASYTAIAHDHAHAYHELNLAHEELKEAQAQLVQSEKMASLGQLTAGIAHEINNPINFVSANVRPLQRDINDLLRLLERYEEIEPGDGVAAQLREIASLKEEIDLTYIIDEIRQLLRGIEEGASRTAEIVRGLRNFSRVDESELKRASLHEGLDSTLVLLHNTYKERIEIVREYGDLPEIECFPGQLNQVFMNLLTNAIHAIEERGTITIGTRRAGESVVVEISDTGAGIPEEIRGRIFDPFFTTKEVGKGTGLGLSISIGIIQKHNGTIELESAVGAGTTFRISLPIHHAR